MAKISSSHPLWRWDSKKIHMDFTSCGVKSKKSPSEKKFLSKYSSATFSTFINALMKALWIREGLLSDSREFGVAETRSGEIYACLQSSENKDVMKHILYNPKTGEVSGCAVDNILSKSMKLCLKKDYGQASADIQQTDGTEVWLALLQTIFSEEEAQEIKGELADAVRDPNAAGFAEAAFRFCDNVYRRSTAPPSPGVGIPIQIPETGIIKKVSEAEIEMIKIRSVLYGTINKGTDKTEVEIDRDKYRSIIEKEWSDEMKMLIPTVPSHWKATRAGQKILEWFYRSKDDPNGNPIKSVLLEGVNGTSKTSLCYYDVAASMGCPVHLFQCCFSTSGTEITGDFVPKTTSKTSEKTKAFLESLPNEIEAKLRPAESWKRLTGEENPKATEFQVLGLLTQKLKEHLAREGEPEDSVNFVYIPSPIVRALKEGGVLILDEITSLANPGETRALNGILDGTTNVFETPEGPITVSEDCYIIGTGNPNSVNANCGEMDLSFRDRFQKVITFEAPSRDRMIDVLLQHGYVTDSVLIERMANTYIQAQAAIESRSIKGIISFRGMIEWSRDLSYGYDFYESFADNVLNKISSREKDREIIFREIQNVS